MMVFPEEIGIRIVPNSNPNPNPNPTLTEACRVRSDGGSLAGCDRRTPELSNAPIHITQDANSIEQ